MNINFHQTEFLNPELFNIDTLKKSQPEITSEEIFNENYNEQLPFWGLLIDPHDTQLQFLLYNYMIEKIDSNIEYFINTSEINPQNNDQERDKLKELNHYLECLIKTRVKSFNHLKVVIPFFQSNNSKLQNKLKSEKIVKLVKNPLIPIQIKLHILLLIAVKKQHTSDIDKKTTEQIYDSLLPILQIFDQIIEQNSQKQQDKDKEKDNENENEQQQQFKYNSENLKKYVHSNLEKLESFFKDDFDKKENIFFFYCFLTLVQAGKTPKQEDEQEQEQEGENEENKENKIIKTQKSYFSVYSFLTFMLVSSDEYNIWEQSVDSAINNSLQYMVRIIFSFITPLDNKLFHSIQIPQNIIQKYQNHIIQPLINSINEESFNIEKQKFDIRFLSILITLVGKQYFLDLKIIKQFKTLIEQRLSDQTSKELPLKDLLSRVETFQSQSNNSQIIEQIYLLYQVLQSQLDSKVLLQEPYKTYSKKLVNLSLILIISILNESEKQKKRKFLQHLGNLLVVFSNSEEFKKLIEFFIKNRKYFLQIYDENKHDQNRFLLLQILENLDIYGNFEELFPRCISLDEYNFLYNTKSYFQQKQRFIRFLKIEQHQNENSIIPIKEDIPNNNSSNSNINNIDLSKLTQVSVPSKGLGKNKNSKKIFDISMEGQPIYKTSQSINEENEVPNDFILGGEYEYSEKVQKEIKVNEQILKVSFYKLADERGWLCNIDRKCQTETLLESNQTIQGQVEDISANGIGIRVMPQYPGNRVGFDIHGGKFDYTESLEKQCSEWKGEVKKLKFYRLSDGRGWIFNNQDKENKLLKEHQNQQILFKSKENDTSFTPEELKLVNCFRCSEFSLQIVQQNDKSCEICYIPFKKTLAYECKKCEAVACYNCIDRIRINAETIEKVQLRSNCNYKLVYPRQHTFQSIEYNCTECQKSSMSCLMFRSQAPLATNHHNINVCANCIQKHVDYSEELVDKIEQLMEIKEDIYNPYNQMLLQKLADQLSRQIAYAISNKNSLFDTNIVQKFKIITKIHLYCLQQPNYYKPSSLETILDNSQLEPQLSTFLQYAQLFFSHLKLLLEEFLSKAQTSDIQRWEELYIEYKKQTNQTKKLLYLQKLNEIEKEKVMKMIEIQKTIQMIKTLFYCDYSSSITQNFRFNLFSKIINSLYEVSSLYQQNILELDVINDQDVFMKTHSVYRHLRQILIHYQYYVNCFLIDKYVIEQKQVNMTQYQFIEEKLQQLENSYINNCFKSFSRIVGDLKEENQEKTIKQALQILSIVNTILNNKQFTVEELNDEKDKQKYQKLEPNSDQFQFVPQHFEFEYSHQCYNSQFPQNILKIAEILQNNDQISQKFINQNLSFLYIIQKIIQITSFNPQNLSLLPTPEDQTLLKTLQSSKKNQTSLLQTHTKQQMFNLQLKLYHLQEKLIQQKYHLENDSRNASKNDQNKPQKKKIQKQIVYKCSRSFKGKSVKVLSDYKVEQTGDSERFALVKPFLPLNSITKFSAKVVAPGGWCSLGIAHQSDIIKEGYQFVHYQQNDLRHGAYLVSNNNYLWNTFKKEQNLKPSGIQFTTNDVIQVEFNPFKKQVKFKKKGDNKTVTLDCRLSKDMCICFNFCNRAVMELINDKTNIMKIEEEKEELKSIDYQLNNFTQDLIYSIKNHLQLDNLIDSQYICNILTELLEDIDTKDHFDIQQQQDLLNQYMRLVIEKILESITFQNTFKIKPRKDFQCCSSSDCASEFISVKEQNIICSNKQNAKYMQKPQKYFEQEDSDLSKHKFAYLSFDSLKEKDNALYFVLEKENCQNIALGVFNKTELQQQNFKFKLEQSEKCIKPFNYYIIQNCQNNQIFAPSSSSSSVIIIKFEKKENTFVFTNVCSNYKVELQIEENNKDSTEDNQTQFYPCIGFLDPYQKTQIVLESQIIGLEEEEEENTNLETLINTQSQNIEKSKSYLLHYLYSLSKNLLKVLYNEENSQNYYNESIKSRFQSSSSDSQQDQTILIQLQNISEKLPIFLNSELQRHIERIFYTVFYKQNLKNTCQKNIQTLSQNLRNSHHTFIQQQQQQQQQQSSSQEQLEEKENKEQNRQQLLDQAQEICKQSRKTFKKYQTDKNQYHYNLSPENQKNRQNLLELLIKSAQKSASQNNDVLFRLGYQQFSHIQSDIIFSTLLEQESNPNNILYNQQQSILKDEQFVSNIQKLTKIDQELSDKIITFLVYTLVKCIQENQNKEKKVNFQQIFDLNKLLTSSLFQIQKIQLQPLLELIHTSLRIYLLQEEKEENNDFLSENLELSFKQNYELFISDQDKSTKRYIEKRNYDKFIFYYPKSEEILLKMAQNQNLSESQQLNVKIYGKKEGKTPEFLQKLIEQYMELYKEQITKKIQSNFDQKTTQNILDSTQILCLIASLIEFYPTLVKSLFSYQINTSKEDFPFLNNSLFEKENLSFIQFVLHTSPFCIQPVISLLKLLFKNPYQIKYNEQKKEIQHSSSYLKQQLQDYLYQIIMLYVSSPKENLTKQTQFIEFEGYLNLYLNVFELQIEQLNRIFDKIGQNQENLSFFLQILNQITNHNFQKSGKDSKSKRKNFFQLSKQTVENYAKKEVLVRKLEKEEKQPLDDQILKYAQFYYFKNAKKWLSNEELFIEPEENTENGLKESIQMEEKYEFSSSDLSQQSTLENVEKKQKEHEKKIKTLFKIAHKQNNNQIMINMMKRNKLSLKKEEESTENENTSQQQQAVYFDIYQYESIFTEEAIWKQHNIEKELNSSFFCPQSQNYLYAKQKLKQMKDQNQEINTLGKELYKMYIDLLKTQEKEENKDKTDQKSPEQQEEEEKKQQEEEEHDINIGDKLGQEETGELTLSQTMKRTLYKLREQKALDFFTNQKGNHGYLSMNWQDITQQYTKQEILDIKVTINNLSGEEKKELLKKIDLNFIKQIDNTLYRKALSYQKSIFPAMLDVISDSDEDQDPKDNKKTSSGGGGMFGGSNTFSYNNYYEGENRFNGGLFGSQNYNNNEQQNQMDQNSDDEQTDYNDSEQYDSEQEVQHDQTDKQIFQDHCYEKEHEKLFQDFNYFKKMPILSDSAVNLLVFSLFTNVEIFKEEEGGDQIAEWQKLSENISQLLQNYLINPINGYKIFDTLFFILQINTPEKLDLLADRIPEFSMIKSLVLQSKNTENSSKTYDSFSIKQLYIERIIKSNLFQEALDNFSHLFFIHGLFKPFDKLQILNPKFEKSRSNILYSPIPTIETARKHLRTSSILILNESPLILNPYILILKTTFHYQKKQELKLLQSFKSLQKYNKTFLQSYQKEEDSDQDNDNDDQSPQQQQEDQYLNVPNLTNFSSAIKNECENIQQQNVIQHLKQIADTEIPDDPLAKNFETSKQNLLYPNYNNLKLLVKNPDIFIQNLQFCGETDSQKLFYNIFSLNSELFVYIPNLFSENSKEAHKIVHKIQEQFKEFKQNFAQKHPNIKLQANSLDQIEDTNKQDIVNYIQEFMEYKDIKSEISKLTTLNVLLKNADKYFKEILEKQIYKKIYILNGITEEKYKEQLKKFENLKKSNKQLYEKKKQKIQLVKKERKKQVKKQFLNALKEHLFSNENINNYLGSSVQLFVEIQQFLGNLFPEIYPENLQELFETPVKMLINIAYLFQLDTNSKNKPQSSAQVETFQIIPPLPKMSRQISKDSAFEDDDFAELGLPKLARLQTSDNISQVAREKRHSLLMLTTPQNKKRASILLDEEDILETNIPKLSRLHEKRHSLLHIQNTPRNLILSEGKYSIEQAFSQLFSSIYIIYSHENFQIIPNLEDPVKKHFYNLAFKSVSDNRIISCKLQAMKQIAQKRAQQQSKQKIQRQQKYNPIDRASPWMSTIKNIFLVYTPSEIVIHDLRVKFEKESGLDWGGLKNEWLVLLSKEVFHPNFGLFIMSSNKRSVQPNPYAFLMPDYLSHFRFLGRLIGKALIENWNLEVCFAKSFLKHILNQTLYVKDLEDLDPEFSRNLDWMLKNEIDEDDDMGVTFTYTQQIFGTDQYHSIELIEGGRNIEVTEDNKKEYVKLLCKAKMTESIKSSILSFKQGIYDIIPQDALNYLSVNELGLQLSGMPSLDVRLLRKYCKMNGFNKDSQTVKHFFEILEEFNDTMKANFIFFLTGSFKIPLDGFKDKPLILDKVNNLQSLPVAHTCFNSIELPDYQNKNLLKEKLLQSLSEGYSGFHIV